MITQILRGAATAVVASLLISGPALAQTSSHGLNTTVAFIQVGGGAGAGSFSVIRALEGTVGEKPLQLELDHLYGMYGQTSVDHFVRSFNYAFNDAWQHAGTDNVMMPSPDGQTGPALLISMINDGTDSTHTFRMGRMMNTLWTPEVYGQVRNNITQRYGSGAMANLNRVGDTFFTDMAQTLGDSQVASRPQ